MKRKYMDFAGWKETVEKRQKIRDEEAKKFPIPVKLDPELLKMVFQYFDIKTYMALGMTCAKMYLYIEDDFNWLDMIKAYNYGNPSAVPGKKRKKNITYPKATFVCNFLKHDHPILKEYKRNRITVEIMNKNSVDYIANKLIREFRINTLPAVKMYNPDTNGNIDCPVFDEYNPDTYLRLEKIAEYVNNSLIKVIGRFQAVQYDANQETKWANIKREWTLKDRLPAKQVLKAKPALLKTLKVRVFGNKIC